MGWSEDMYSRRGSSHEDGPQPLLGSTAPSTPDNAPRPLAPTQTPQLSSSKAARAPPLPHSKPPGSAAVPAGSPQPPRTPRSKGSSGHQLDAVKQSPQQQTKSGGDGMGTLLLVGAAMASTALQKAGLLSPGNATKGQHSSSPAASRRSRGVRPPLPQPILATTPRGYHDTKVKTPRGMTPRSVRFSDDLAAKDSPPPQRTPRALPPPPLSPTLESDTPTGIPVGKAAAAASSIASSNEKKSRKKTQPSSERQVSNVSSGGVPMGRAASVLAYLPVQLAASVFNAVHSAGGGVAGMASSPFRHRQHPRPIKRKSPRASSRSGPIRVQAPVSPSGSVGSSSSGGSKVRGSVDIPRLSLANKGVGGGEGGKQSKSPARSPARSPGHSPASSGRSSISSPTGEAGAQRRQRQERSPLRRGPLGVFGGNKVAARCEAAEAEVDALDSINEKLRSVLRETQMKLASAVTAGRDSREAALLESSRRATALSEANKQLERLESKLKQRQAAVDGLVTPRSHAASPRVGSSLPQSPHTTIAASPRVGLDSRFAFKSPRVGEGRDLWPGSSPRRSASAGLTLAGLQTPRTAAAAAITERRIAELRAKLTSQQGKADEALRRVDELGASLAERDGELADLRGRLAEGLSEAQLAAAADLKRQLAAERHRTTDQAQLVKHLQLSLSGETERVTDLHRQLEDCHNAMEAFDEQAQSQVAYVADLQDMCEELQSMQSTMTHKTSASSRQASTLQEQLTVSLGVIERLEQSAVDRREEAAAERSALEAALEDARALNDEVNRRLQQSQLAVQLAESDRDEVLAALQEEERGGGHRGNSTDASADGRDDIGESSGSGSADGGQAGSNVRSLAEGAEGGAPPSRHLLRKDSARETLYEKQITELQAEVASMRKESRAAKGAEADSSAGVQQLEARLAVATIDHKQDVRRMAETIESLEGELREARRVGATAKLDDVSQSARAASATDGSSGGDNDSTSPNAQGPAGSLQSGQGSQHSVDDSPRANRLMVLTKRLEDVMGVSLQRTTGSHSRMASEIRPFPDSRPAPDSRLSLDSRPALDSRPSLDSRLSLDSRPALDSRPSAFGGQQRPPSAEKPPKRPTSSDVSRQRLRPPTPSRPSSDATVTPTGGGDPGSSRKPPRGRSLDQGRAAVQGAAETSSSAPSQPPPPTASGLLAMGFGNITSQFPAGGRLSSERSISSGLGGNLPRQSSLERLSSSNASLAGASVDFIVPPVMARVPPSPRRAISESVDGSSFGSSGASGSDTSVDTSEGSSTDSSTGEDTIDSEPPSTTTSAFADPGLQQQVGDHRGLSGSGDSRRQQARGQQHVQTGSESQQQSEPTGSSGGGVSFERASSRLKASSLSDATLTAE